jgi:hypothetical protein
MDMYHFKSFFDEIKRILVLNHLDEPSANEKYCIGCTVSVVLKNTGIEINITNELAKGKISFVVSSDDSVHVNERNVIVDCYNNDEDLCSTITLSLDSVILLGAEYVWEDRKKEVNNFE